ncbi:hypothetical protein ACW73L_15825 [Methylolobus aquaticus]
MTWSLPKRAKAAMLCIAEFSAGYASNGEAETPRPALDKEEQGLLQRALGPGVVGSSLAAQRLDNPAALLAPANRTMTYRLLDAEHSKQTEIHQIAASPAPQGNRLWQHRLGKREVRRLVELADGSLAVSGVDDFGDGVAARYSPPRPFLVKGMIPGEQREASLSVQAFDLEQSDRLLYSGSLKVAVAYLGAYQVTVPAGRYDAALVRYAARGTIGPADVDTTQYLFLSPGTGIVASVESREVSAFTVYHRSENLAAVLTSVSDPQ